MSHAYDVFIREGGNLIRSKSLGLTNIKEDTFNEFKSKFPAEFSGKNWSDPKEDPDLAIMAATYNLEGIQDQYAGEVPDELKEKFTLDQFLAAGYNAERNIPDYFEAGYLDTVVQGMF